VHAKEDKFVVLTGDEHVLRSQAALLKKRAGLDLQEERFLVVDCKDIAHVFDVTRGAGVPTVEIEGTVTRAVKETMQAHQGVGGVIVESIDLLPYVDALKEATGLPVWDAVTACELYSSLRTHHHRFEYHDWLNEVAFEFGVRESRQWTESRPRLLGVVGLDYENERAPTDHTMRASRGYKAIFKSIPDLTRYLTSLGKLTKVCEKALREVLQWMSEDQRVCAITGDCSFMMHYQVLIRDAVNVPVFMSPLMFPRMLLPMLGEKEKILVVTADRKLLEEQKNMLMSHCGFDILDLRYTILGCEDIPGLEKLGKKGEFADEATVQMNFLNRMSQCLSQWPEVGTFIGAIVVECIHLLPHTQPLRELTGMPVLDAVTCAEYFIAARKQNDRYGIKQWPYLWDGSVEEF